MAGDAFGPGFRASHGAASVSALTGFNPYRISSSALRKTGSRGSAARQKEYPDMNSLEVTEAASAAVAVAPRVTLESMESKIESEEYTLIDGILTICVLKMANGFYVTGESAPASPANFNAKLGRQFAREQAVRKLWGFEGYALRERLAAAA